jgi:hypothetical protein
MEVGGQLHTDCFIPGERAPSTECIRGSCAPQPVDDVEESFTSSKSAPRFLGCPPCSLVTILTELSQLLESSQLNIRYQDL